MKKILIILAIIISFMLLTNKESDITIPNNNIRFRVIASSNSIKDQEVKIGLSKDLSAYLMDIKHTSNNKEDIIKDYVNNKNNIENHINNYLNENNLNIKYNLNIGRNKFNKKIYKGVTYDAGYYDSIVVELGEGRGLNWWCIVYPPLCNIEDNNNSNDIEYKSYIKEILDKYNI